MVKQCVEAAQIDAFCHGVCLQHRHQVVLQPSYLKHDNLLYYCIKLNQYVLASLFFMFS